MNIVICLFRKKYRNGENIEYILVDKDMTSIDSVMENWGESSDGGHNYGYTVFCDEIIEKPTKQVIDYLTKKLAKDIGYLESSIENKKTKIAFLTTMSNSKIPKKYRDIYERVKGGEPLFQHGKFGTTEREFTIGSPSRSKKYESVDKKIVEWLLKKKYLKQGMIIIDYEGKENFKHEYFINI